MENLIKALPQVLLMGPGPSCVPPSVYSALASPTIGHMDPRFLQVMDAVKGSLRELMQTDNRLTFPISGTGSAGMETAFVNLIEPGDKVLILGNGVFGQRMRDVAQRLRAEVDTLEFPWGTPVLVDSVRKQLNGKGYQMVAVVHAETSTGVCNPVKEIGEVVRQTKALYVVDTVTSLGGMPVTMDEWGADVLYSGTQKCLSCPPGLAPISFSERAVGKVLARKTKVPNWYLDVSMILKYWDGASRVYHHTAPINMVYGLYQALHCILAEGMEEVFARHAEVHEQLVEGLQRLGCEMFVAAEYRLPMLNAVKVPGEVEESRVRMKLLQDHHIEIGPGLGPMAGVVWRIGIMGHTARTENVTRMLQALGQVLNARECRKSQEEPGSRAGIMDPVQMSGKQGVGI